MTDLADLNWVDDYSLSCAGNYSFMKIRAFLLLGIGFLSTSLFAQINPAGVTIAR
ncbi:MAG: hypothetical protein JWP57_3053, partial [Spirosoma sp.]|nr:hypothetical protein [Spirosoma sp.]